VRQRGQVIPEVVIEAPGISPARKPRINLRPTGDEEACEDPRESPDLEVAAAPM
jgi:hypothetical protein